MNKRQGFKSDSKPVKLFLTLQGHRGNNNRISSVSIIDCASDKPEVLAKDQTCFALKLDIPVSSFEVPVYQVKVDQMIPEEVIAEVQSWITHGDNE